MDPEAALNELIDALEDGDALEAAAYLESLTGWLARGGFAPDWGRAHRRAGMAVGRMEEGHARPFDGFDRQPAGGYVCRNDGFFNHTTTTDED